MILFCGISSVGWKRGVAGGALDESVGPKQLCGMSREEKR